MTGFSLSTATADTAAREHFIQVMAIGQNGTERGYGTGQKWRLIMLRNLVFFQSVWKSSVRINL